MLKNIKITAVFIIVLAGIFALVYSFLGGSQMAVAPGDSGTLIKSQPRDESSDALNLPEPTGKTKDMVEAVMTDAASEEELVEQEADDAEAAIDDSEELDDFGQIYDAEEF
ncbi:MAG: hypothetical protein QG620_259 [Patescibacteria group bacterium]|nr:hypothetical protein [Patescibacteria group bacterium]